ncbi:MAG TPA: Calx-beta domain-containing protein, partial [Myxococcales bacterium]|nr:Calx-beta domain-containing protein [Myxococcales bacterium]
MRPPRPARSPRALLAVLFTAVLIHFAPACGDGGGGDGGQSATIAFAAASSSGGEPATPVHLTVELSAPLSAVSASVDVAVTGGTASAGADFTLGTATVTVPAGQTQVTVDLDVAQDGFDEPDETVELTLTNPRSSGMAALTLGATRVHTYTIQAQSASPTPTLSLRAPALAADESETAASIVVQLSRAASSTVTVAYALAGGTATAGADFTLVAGTLSFPAGTLTQTISVPIANDTVDEEDETVLVALSSPSGAQLGGPTTATLTIADDDQTPTVSFSASTQSADESDGAVQLAVALSAASGRDVTVSYGVNGGTATGGGVDYTLASGTLTIPAGQTSGSISLTVVEDTAVEGGETVSLALSNPVNAALGNVAGMALQIVDNDGLPLVGFAASTSSSLENGGVASVMVTLSATSSQNVQVSYTVTGGTAARGTDYNLADGTVIFTPGQTSRPIAINVLGDSVDEDDETIVITLSTPVNAALGSRTVHTFSITDDDVSPIVAFAGSAFTV